MSGRRSYRSRNIIREQIEQNLPLNANFHPTTIDEVVETMATSNNSHVIFFDDDTYELEMRHSIKRFGFKNRLHMALQNAVRPIAILAMTCNYIGNLDVYVLNGAGTNYIRISLSSTTSGSGSDAPVPYLPAPMPYVPPPVPAPGHNPHSSTSDAKEAAERAERMQNLMKSYEKVRQALYPRRPFMPFPEDSP